MTKYYIDQFNFVLGDTTNDKITDETTSKCPRFFKLHPKFVFILCVGLINCKHSYKYAETSLAASCLH